MSYYAYLLTLDYLMNQEDFEIKLEKEGKISLLFKDQSLSLSLPDSNKDINRLSRAREIVEVTNYLLNRSYPISSPDKCIAYLLWEDYLESKIKMSWFKDSQVQSLVSKKLISFSSSSCLDFETLYISKMIREGYTLKEEQGKHILVFSPNGVTMVCTPFECQCAKGLKQDCKHKRLVRYFLKYRECFDPLRPNS